MVLDLSLLRQPGEDQRQAVLQQLTTAIGRLWAAYQHSNAGNGGAATQRISWGYALYDSACPDLLLKPQLRRTAQNLREWRAVQAAGAAGSREGSSGLQRCARIARCRISSLTSLPPFRPRLPPPLPVLQGSPPLFKTMCKPTAAERS